MVLNGSITNHNRVVYLLTDGNNTAGSNPVSAIPSYQTNNIPMYTFGYGSDADAALLQKLATDTGGKYYFSPTILTDITNVFQDANLQTSPSVGITSRR